MGSGNWPGPFEWANLAVGLLLQIIVAVVLLLAAVWIWRTVVGPKPPEPPQPAPRPKPDAALEILRQRYAKGKIDTAEYLHMQSVLQPAGTGASASPAPRSDGDGIVRGNIGRNERETAGDR